MRLEPAEAIARRFPESVGLLTTWDSVNARCNVMPCGWFMMTSRQPPMFAVSVGLTRYTHEILERADGGQFVLCLPVEGMEEAVRLCGSRSGRDTDKVRETGLVELPSSVVRPPALAGCAVALECRVISRLLTSDHTIFVGEVVAAQTDDQASGRRRLVNLGGGRIVPME